MTDSQTLPAQPEEFPACPFCGRQMVLQQPHLEALCCSPCGYHLARQGSIKAAIAWRFRRSPLIETAGKLAEAADCIDRTKSDYAEGMIEPVLMGLVEEKYFKALAAYRAALAGQHESKQETT